MNGRIQDALPFLEKASAEDANNVKSFIYLGMIYQSLGRDEEAIASYLKILPRAKDESALVAYNLGNVYYSMGNIAQAENYYTRAIKEDESFSSAYLNRANSRLCTDRFDEAFEDYERYLALEPKSPKRPQIEQIRALALAERAAQVEKAREEEEKAAREAQEQALAEQERIEAEEKLAQAEKEAEIERKQEQEELERAKQAWKALFFEGVVESLKEEAEYLVSLPLGPDLLRWEAYEFELE